MSGGSLDYVCYKVEEAADRIKGDERPLYRAFGRHLDAVAKALYAVEWEYSRDTGRDSSVPDIQAAIGEGVKVRVLEEVLGEMRDVARKIEETLNSRG